MDSTFTVVERNAIGWRSVVRRNVSAVAAEIAIHQLGLSGGGGEEGDGNQCEFGQSFRGVEFFLEARSFVSAAFAASFLFVHSNSLHSLHRKR